jgi:hypothetical protein
MGNDPRLESMPEMTIQEWAAEYQRINEAELEDLNMIGETRTCKRSYAVAI